MRSPGRSKPRGIHANIAGDMSLLRVVIDTNVLVAATRDRNGASFKLMQYLRQEHFSACASSTLFLEYEAVLKRAEQRRVSGLSIQDVDTMLHELARLIQPVALHFRWRPQLRDANDEMVLEAAANAGADAIVTFNQRDFVPAAKQFDLDIRLPAEVLKQLGSTQGKPS